MVSLTRFVYLFKKASTFLALVLGIVLVLTLIYILGVNLKKSLFPDSPLPATVAFGKLAKIDLTQGINPQRVINYKIETISGDLTELSLSAKVLRIGPDFPSFGKLEEVKARAKQLKFDGEPQVLDGLFKFIDTKDSTRVLTVSNYSGSFILDSKLENSTRPPSTEGTKSRARDFFGIFGLDVKEFPDDKIEIVNLKFKDGKLTLANSFSDASLLKVNFNRANLDKLPVYPIVEGQNLVWAIVGAEGILSAKMDFYNLERFSFATYPLKGVRKAYAELQKGLGVFNKPITEETFAIKNVSLGYVEGSKRQGFLQPVYVFGGDNNIRAYVAAVDDLWIVR